MKNNNSNSSKYITPLYDSCFKYVYCNSNSLNNELIGNPILSKHAVLDSKFKINGKYLCNIEMQLLDASNTAKRMLFYYCNMYPTQLIKGDKYNKLHKTICIFIQNFYLDKTKDISRYHTHWSLRESELQNCVLTDDVDFHIIELPKINKGLINSDEELWLRFLSDPNDEEVTKKMSTNAALREAKNLVDKFNNSKELRVLAFSEELKEHDRVSREDMIRTESKKEGKKEGRLIGTNDTKIAFAKKLLKTNLNIKEIADFTELSIAKINSLKNNMNKK